VKILVVGSGGREHALALALSRDPEVDRIYAAPGNPGIEEVATCTPITATSIEQLASFATEHQIDLTIVGPEAPLALGIVDVFRKRGLRIFGPDAGSARIETSKSFAKDLCTKLHIPTPHWQVFTNATNAARALNHFSPPWVVKADGLASGKGTTVTRDRQEAEAAIHHELQREPGRVVLEEFVEGWEATFMATVSHGNIQWITPVFQDYKPVYDGDEGPNTGGMGCYSPVPTITTSLVEKVEKTILSPAVAGMEKAGAHYTGLLNLNAIIQNGTEEPFVLEFNARFGDPECQGVLSLTEHRLASHLYSIADDSNNPAIPKSRQLASVVVVLASKGYPTAQLIGDKIMIRPASNSNATILHAGTARNTTAELVTAGGRVLNVIATGTSVESARREAYSTIKAAIQFNGMQYRSDIGAPRARQRNLQAQRA